MTLDFTDLTTFLDHGVVLVTVNYRLGPFGFLSLENEDIPGNMGLHDQVNKILRNEYN